MIALSILLEASRTPRMTAIFNGIIHIEAPLSQLSQNYSDKYLRSLGQVPMEHPTHGQVKFMSMHGQAWDCMRSRLGKQTMCHAEGCVKLVLSYRRQLS